MITRTVASLIGTPRDVHGEGWRSRRLLLAEDGTGYSLHETTLEAGIELRFAYARHRETVYCVEGEGSIREVATGRTLALVPGTMYSAGIGEEHAVSTSTEMKLLCVFTPPLAGREEAD